MSTHGYNMPDGPATAPPPPPPSAGPVPGGPGAHRALPHQGVDPTAVGVRRSLAWLIDAVIFFVLLLTFSAVGPFGRYESEAALAEAGFTLDDGCEAIEDATGTWQCFSAPGGVPFLEDDRLYFIDNEYLVLGTAAWLAYFVLVYVVVQGVTGATAGKYAMGVRVVDDLGQAPGMGRSLTRSALWVIDGTPWIIPGLVAFVVSLISVGHRRIGDMAADTFVVRVDDTGRPLQVPGYTPFSAPEYQMPERPQPTTGAVGGQSLPEGAEPSPLGQALMEISQTQGEAAPPTMESPGQTGTDRTRPDAPQQTVPLAGPGPASAVPREAPGPDAGTADSAPGETVPADRAPAGNPSPEPAQTVQASPLVPPSPDPSAPPTLQPGPEVMAALEASAGTPEPEGTPEPVPERVAEQPRSTQVPGTAPGAPQPQAPPPPAAPTQPPPPPPVYPPQWDPGRGAYIQWDPGRGRWLQWDATAESWHAI